MHGGAENVRNRWFGRPFRLGTVGVAIGVSGLPPLWDRRGEPDLFGRALENTVTALADQVAAVADLVAGQAAERRPLVLLRGLGFPASEEGASALIRTRSPSASACFAQKRKTLANNLRAAGYTVTARFLSLQRICPRMAASRLTLDKALLQRCTSRWIERLEAVRLALATCSQAFPQGGRYRAGLCPRLP